jgi:hypothetical protein
MLQTSTPRFRNRFDRNQVFHFHPMYSLFSLIAATALSGMVVWFLLPMPSLHHLHGIYPLPSKRATLLVTLVGFVGVTVTALLSRYGDWRRVAVVSEQPTPPH